MKTKTISMHYDSVFSLEHNNRMFTPHNVDQSRTKWNYNCITAGEDACLDFEDPRYTREFWERYKELNALYWSNRAAADELEYARYRDHMRYLRKCHQMVNFYPENEVEAFFYILLLPLIIFGETVLTVKEIQEEAEHFKFKCEKKHQIQDFWEMKCSARAYLYDCDKTYSTTYLKAMDHLMKEAARSAENYVLASEKVLYEPRNRERFATIEEIYNKLFEPSFRAFQEKQRPCRRYEGTYLEYIREGQRQMTLKKKQNRNNKNRKTAEAIEFVIGVGDMDNTGYVNAFRDAKNSETLLKDYCDHLMQQKTVCFVTTRELDDPDWQPPFKHGLIVLNLTVHCDEATPGIHLTCIPYSRGCKRGPAVQAALGRAMTGMGYPSTWKDVLDEKGERIPKRTKEGNVILNQDGTVRYRQEPDRQGVIDWIEEQKTWIQREMKQRYGWEREYKGSHPRGNLSTPDYQVARAEERRQEMERQIDEMLRSFVNHIDSQIDRLDESVEKIWRDASDWEKVLKYLSACPEEEYMEYVRRAEKYLDYLPREEQEKIKPQLQMLISEAAKKTKVQPSAMTEKTHNYDR